MIAIDEELIEAEVRSYKHGKDGRTVIYILKVSLPEVGFYINSVTVQPSEHPGESWWVQLPRYFAGQKWRFPLEANTKKPLWQAVEAAAIKAVEAYAAENYIPTDEELNRPFTADDFNLPEESKPP